MASWLTVVSWRGTDGPVGACGKDDDEPMPDPSAAQRDENLYVSLSFGGNPAEARVIARNGQMIEGWESGPVLGDALVALEREGWSMRAGHLSRTESSLLPQPVLILGRSGTG
jgi:hypothetical protein